MTPLEYFDCEVTECESYYLVKIHPQDKEIAKSIRGRSWDGEINRWVYPKTKQIHQEITAKLKPVAKIFKISPPEDSEESEEKTDIHSSPPSRGNNKKEEMTEELARIEAEIFSLRSIIVLQSEQLERINAVLRVDGEQNATDAKGEELDPRNPEDARKVGQLIKDIMIWGGKEAGNEQVSAISELFAFEGILEFVMRTHELVIQEVLKTTTPSKDDGSFTSLITKARRENNYISTRDGTLDIYNSLYILNGIRNILAHPEVDIPKSRIMLMGITYAFLVSELWVSIAQSE